MTRRLYYGLAAILVLSAVAQRPMPAQAAAQPATYQWDDSHFHLTNYVQEGADVRDFLRIMGTKVGRSTLFGIPLQQTWSYANSGDFAPTYYLQTDAPLYYYSFTDAFIAMAYLGLDPADRARFDPMITGFNPSDMYAVESCPALREIPGMSHTVRLADILAALRQLDGDNDDDDPPHGGDAVIFTQRGHRQRIRHDRHFHTPHAQSQAEPAGD